MPSPKSSTRLPDSHNVIDGRAIAAQILRELAQRVAALNQRGVQPGLAFVRVGEDPASKVYVGRKEQACAELGIFSETRVLPENTREEELLAMRILHITPLEYIPEETKAIQQVLERGYSNEIIKDYIHKNGARVPASVRIMLRNCCCSLSSARQAGQAAKWASNRRASAGASVPLTYQGSSSAASSTQPCRS